MMCALDGVQSIVQTVVRSTLSLTFVIAACRVVFNIKGRVIRWGATVLHSQWCSWLRSSRVMVACTCLGLPFPE